MTEDRKRRRVRREPEAARTHLLEAAKKIMLEEGYAAVGPRRVASVAEVSPTLVHYYFPTTDDLFVALYKYTSGEDLGKLEAALASRDPLQAFWTHQNDEARSALAVEFLAVTNHRKALRTEMVAFAENARKRQAEALSPFLAATGLLPDICAPVCAVTLMTAVARTLNMERDVGVSLGHAETKRFANWLLDRLRAEGSPEPASDTASTGAA
jgi:AcrR family transcriptional regulator